MVRLLATLVLVLVCVAVGSAPVALAKPWFWPYDPAVIRGPGANLRTRVEEAEEELRLRFQALVEASVRSLYRGFEEARATFEKGMERVLSSEEVRRLQRRAEELARRWVSLIRSLAELILLLVVPWPLG